MCVIAQVCLEFLLLSILLLIFAQGRRSTLIEVEMMAICGPRADIVDGQSRSLSESSRT